MDPYKGTEVSRYYIAAEHLGDMRIDGATEGELLIMGMEVARLAKKARHAIEVERRAVQMFYVSRLQNMFKALRA